MIRRSFKDYNENSRKDTGLYGNVYDFSVDYSAIANDKIVDIHNYLIKKNNIICSDLLKNVFLQQ